VPGAVLVLVGAADQQEIEAAHRRVGDDLRARVRCVPRQPRDRIDAFIALATVLVSPRAYGGNFPLKVFDYLAAGKPIVATDVPTHRVVLDDRLALLVEPNAAACADGIIRVLKDQELAARLAAAARRFADQELSWGRFVALVEELYDLALRPQATPPGR
jgi:glycosyltransferase involved in cell wall biosynthesis